MQIDMHYYGTYAMARAAGLNKETCKKIAYSSQFVDDNVEHREIHTENGALISVAATAHHNTDKDIGKEEEQTQVWVPFHFLPGGVGDSYEEKSVCRKNSAVAQEMFEHYLSLPVTDFTPYLIGIAAHVYAETFSHYGFSGVPSDTNEIVGDSFEFKDNFTGETRNFFPNKLNVFWLRVAENAAERISDGLGYGAAFTYSDRPFLIWRFEHGSGNKSDWRNNPKTFLEACEKLHAYFKKFAQNYPEFQENRGLDFAAIKGAVITILSLQEKMPGRIKAWQEYAKSGELFGAKEVIPRYGARIWQDRVDNEGTSLLSHGLNSDISHFLKAAFIHRTFVLNELLPKYGIQVS